LYGRQSTENLEPVGFAPTTVNPPAMTSRDTSAVVACARTDRVANRVPEWRSTPTRPDASVVPSAVHTGGVVPLQCATAPMNEPPCESCEKLTFSPENGVPSTRSTWKVRRLCSQYPDPSAPRTECSA
jgi:hypothetical protein